MATKTYTLDVRWTGEHYEATIPDIAATVTGTTFDEAVENGNRAIALALMAAKKVPRRPRQTRKRKGKSVA